MVDKGGAFPDTNNGKHEESVFSHVLKAVFLLVLILMIGLVLFIAIAILGTPSSYIIYQVENLRF